MKTCKTTTKSNTTTREEKCAENEHKEPQCDNKAHFKVIYISKSLTVAQWTDVARMQPGFGV